MNQSKIQGKNSTLKLNVEKKKTNTLNFLLKWNSRKKKYIEYESLLCPSYLIFLAEVVVAYEIWTIDLICNGAPKLLAIPIVFFFLVSQGIPTTGSGEINPQFLG